MRKSKSALFLMELIVVVFFFSLTSAVCLRVFVKAHEIADNTTALNAAILWADNAGECFGEYGPDEGRIRALLDPEFNYEDYAYSIAFSSDDSFDYMDYKFTSKDGSKEYYSFTFKKHIQEVAP